MNATTSSSGLGPIVTSFNNFRYTVLVPTKEALDRAFAEDPELWTWEQIAAETDAGKKKEKTLYLLNFLRYHSWMAFFLWERVFLITVRMLRRLAMKTTILYI